MDRLQGAGREVRVLSRSGRPGTVRADLLTGEGFDEAVEGVDVIVHCASNPRCVKPMSAAQSISSGRRYGPVRRTSSTSPSSASTATLTILTTG